MSAVIEETTMSNPVLPILRELLDSTSLTSPNELAEAIIVRLTEDEQREVFPMLLSHFVAMRMPHGLPKTKPEFESLGEVGTSVKAGQKIGTTIKKAGVPWSHPGGKVPSWDKRRFSTGIQDEWVFWPEFTRDMALRKKAVHEKIADTHQKSAQQYALIESFLKDNGVEKVGDLKPKVKKALETDLENLD